MTTTPFLTGGRIAMSIAALSCSVSCYIADFNETHVYNPKWPPHARFHNGQTMSLGLTLGLLGQYLIWRPVFDRTVSPRDSAFVAAIVGSLYWICGMSGILYPGTKWLDPEFGDGSPQAPVFAAHVAITWLGYWATVKGLKGLKNA